MNFPEIIAARLPGISREIPGQRSLLAAKPFMTSFWHAIPLGNFGKLDLGTPLLFDLGVYLVVCGVTLLIVFSLAEE